MRLMNDILENRLLGRWGELLPRSPLQRGALHETDAELIDIGGGRLLALTVDAVVEEVRVGLYKTPRTVGRIAAVSSLSDLAAVGAEPLGVLVCATLPNEDQDVVQAGVAGGLREVLDAEGLFVLGGDTNEGEHLALAVTAAGLVPEKAVVTRVGARPGDQVFVSGLLGAGGAYAAAVLLGIGNMDEAAFRPTMRLREGMALRGIASSCMDTSDGFVATIDQVARINEVGIRITAAPAGLLHPTAAAARAVAGLPAFPFLASYHGEFELVFSVPPEKVSLLADRANAMGWKPIPVGIVEPEPGVRFGNTEIDSAKVRNAFALSAGNLDAYMRSLVESGVG
jgi:thiamine-monophosphate kinase